MLTSLHPMNHAEIRHRILVYLYKRYYDGLFFDSLATEDVVEELEIPSDLERITYTNINYLDDKRLVHGTKVCGLSYPKWIRIDTYGLDEVEQKEPEYAKLHYEIRFRILSRLYEHNFGDHQESTVLVDIRLVRSLRLKDSDQNLVYGDIIYLYDKGLIEGYKQVGMAYPFRINITSYGIDIFESIMNRSLETIADTSSDAGVKTKVKDIIEEVDQKSKFEKFRDFVGENASWIELVANIARSWFTGG